MNNRSVPSNILVPHLVYRNVTQARDWLSRVFGFTEHFHYGDPVSGIQIYLGSAVIMISEPRPHRESPAIVGSNTQMLTVIVNNVDAHYKHTVEQGATIWEDLHETVYGERQYGVEDLDGHQWIFSQHARDLSPEQWGATIVTPMPV
jgi:uncharacterized glyoxalase superfamily protein PhnB